MIPEKRLFQAVVILALLAAGLIVLGAQLPTWRSGALLLWSLLAALLLVTAAVDAWRAWRQPPPEGSRRLPAAFSAGQPGTVQLRFNSATLPDECLLSDQHPADDSHTGLPLIVRRADRALTLVDYPYRPSRRGQARFGAIELWCPSPWRLAAQCPAGAEQHPAATPGPATETPGRRRPGIPPTARISPRRHHAADRLARHSPAR